MKYTVQLVILIMIIILIIILMMLISTVPNQKPPYKEQHEGYGKRQGGNIKVSLSLSLDIKYAWMHRH